jgi:hypothetical protein
VLLEELARVEFVDGLDQLSWGRLGAKPAKVGAFQAFEGGRELGMS